jgi:hypothetical protein|tara:strand:+ start:332 stop:565 length:234 start_codon:yes stop_codon:yes gene_type:complete
MIRVTGNTTRLTKENLDALIDILEEMKNSLVEDAERDVDLSEIDLAESFKDFVKLTMIQKQLLLNEMLLETYGEDEE